MNKYNIAFQIMGLLPAFLVTPHRKILLNKHLYFSIVGVLVLISPNLLWRYQNDFPVFHHLQALAETQLVHVKRMDFLKDQFLFFMGSFLIIIAALLSFFLYKPFKEYRVFFWSFLITISLFIILQAKSYYAMGLYPILLAFGSVYLEKLLNNYSRHKNLRAVSMSADYIHWIPLDLEIKHMILVKDKWDADRNREKEKPYFHIVDFVGEIENPYAREKGTRIYLMKDAKISINDILRKEIKKRDKF